MVVVGRRQHHVGRQDLVADPHPGQDRHLAVVDRDGLVGEGEALVDGRRVSGAEALAGAGIAKLQLFVLVSAWALCAPAAALQVDRYAVLVGQNSGDAGEPDLQYAERDAAKLKAVLETHLDDLCIKVAETPGKLEKRIEQIRDRFEAYEEAKRQLALAEAIARVAG